MTDREAYAAYARFGALLADLAEWAHRDARRLRGVAELSVKAGRRRMFDETAQSILRMMQELEALDLSEIMFLAAADIGVEGQHDVTNMGILGMVPRDDVPQFGTPINASHGVSPDNGRAA